MFGRRDNLLEPRVRQLEKTMAKERTKRELEKGLRGGYAVAVGSWFMYVNRGGNSDHSIVTNQNNNFSFVLPNSLIELAAALIKKRRAAAKKGGQK